MPGPLAVISSKRIARFVRLGSANWILLFEAAMMLAFARTWLAIVPFRKVAGRLGVAGRVTSAEPAPLDEHGRAAARAIGWALRRTAPHAPFRAVCLQQAVAAKLMLARRGIPARVHFGMAPTRTPGEEPRAHAWVSAGKIEVSGYPLDSDLVPVARFE